ncbi:hypothetical protein VTK73DRAFT_7537 [Phialemonium thermophilum]|uniref:Uncharacterized protein n=1 Tax=Phialemonium thermophilum TaxID=223376 RepID=A0ABR3WDP7_9PEZI
MPNRTHRPRGTLRGHRLSWRMKGGRKRDSHTSGNALELPPSQCHHTSPRTTLAVRQHQTSILAHLYIERLWPATRSSRRGTCWACRTRSFSRFWGILTSAICWPPPEFATAFETSP